MKKEYFINANITYEVINTKRSSFGITALLKSQSGNYIVANGLNFTKHVRGNDIVSYWGSWDGAQYFMKDSISAEAYFLKVESNWK